MPNWKKLISSGSEANLKRLTVDHSISASHLDIEGDIVSKGNIIAKQYIVSSSVSHITESFSSGSTLFGDSLDDTHIFTGSVLITGSVTANLFNGDGSGLTNVKVDQLTSLSSTFTNILSQSFEHTLDSTNINVTIYDQNEEQIIPQKVKILTSSSLEVFFDVPTSGRAILTRGGHIIDTFVLSSDLTLTSASFVSQSSVSVGHMFNTKNINVTVYDDQDYQLLPKDVYLTDLDNVRVDFSKETSGTIVVTKGGHVLSGSIDNANTLNGQPGSFYSDFDNLTNVPTLISGSNQIQELTTFRAVVSGSTSYIITHSLDYQWPIVQCYRGDVIPQRQVQPNDIISLSGFHSQVTFTTPFVGSIVFKK